MTSLENWSPIMIQAMNSVATDQQPLFLNNPWMGLYFVVFIILGVFLILNMVVGVAINTVSHVAHA